MSLLFADQTDDWALLVSDTLVATPDKAPYLFGSKVEALPQFNMALASLGAALLGQAWRHSIDTTPGIADIEDLNEIAPQTLRSLWADLNSRYEGLPPTATFYHFGFPEGSDKIVSYTYRSGDNFESERFVGSRFTVKPVPPDYKYDRPQSSEEVIELALRVRQANDEADGWGVRIGGELYATKVENRLIWTERWHRFE